jgi:hypothetical protein
MTAETNVVVALAAWNRAIEVINGTSADIRAGRNVASARQVAEQAIRDGSRNAMIVGQATWFTPPVDTQQRWEQSLMGYQDALKQAGVVVTTTSTTDGIRIGNVIVPWSTVRNVVLLLGVIGFGVYLLSRQQRNRR